MTKARKIVFVSVIVAVSVLLALGGLYDKTISQNLCQGNNLGAQLFESLGTFPPFVFVAATFAVLFFLVKEEDRCRIFKKTVCVCLTAVSYLVFGFVGSETFLTAFWARAVTALCTAIVLTPPTVLFFLKKDQERLKKYAIFLIFASIVCVVSSLITVNVIKFIWGRVRYREMMQEGDVALKGFTAWYHPNGFSLSGHHSFPSAHTSAASNLLVLCALDEVFPEAHGKKKTVIFVVSLYIFTMAYSRIVLGAHFLSDVTVGFLIGYLAFFVARYLYFDKSKTVISALMQKQEENAEGADEPAEEAADVLSEQVISEEVTEPEEGADVAEEETDEGLLLYKDRHEIRAEAKSAPIVQEEEYEPDEDVPEQEADVGILLYKSRRDIRASDALIADEEDFDDDDEDEDY
ncbi:MAG TPA: hypothetical protein DIC18_04190 [Clostridiales bacterium]|nr:hypothetical protein [Clostridiales bacterium]